MWLNIVTDGLQDLSLSFEKAEKNIMKDAPRNPKENLFNQELKVYNTGKTEGERQAAINKAEDEIK